MALGSILSTFTLVKSEGSGCSIVLDVSSISGYQVTFDSVISFVLFFLEHLFNAFLSSLL
jgi:hypothetical protein